MFKVIKPNPFLHILQEKQAVSNLPKESLENSKVRL